MKLTTYAISLMSLALPTVATAASGDLTVSGTITPEACTLSLPGGDALDFGDLTPLPTENGKWAFVESRNAELTVTCPSKMRVGLEFRDLTLAAPPSAKDGFLLVTDEDDALAMVELRFPDGVADGETISFAMLSAPGGVPHMARADDPGNYMVIGDPDVGYHNVKTTMRVTMQGQDLDAAEAATATGLRSTIGIELRYL